MDDVTRATLKSLTPKKVDLKKLGGEPVTEILTEAPGNNAPIGGCKVVTKDGWFAVRPSGTEAIYKLYAESFRGADHLKSIQKDAGSFVERLLGK